jgi:hypothetical protein
MTQSVSTAPKKRIRRADRQQLVERLIAAAPDWIELDPATIPGTTSEDKRQRLWSSLTGYRRIRFSCHVGSIFRLRLTRLEDGAVVVPPTRKGRKTRYPVSAATRAIRAQIAAASTTDWTPSPLTVEDKPAQISARLHNYASDAGVRIKTKLDKATGVTYFRRIAKTEVS